MIDADVVQPSNVNRQIIAFPSVVGQSKAELMKKRVEEMDGALYMGRPDCDNIAKSVLDALNGVAFADDSQVASLVVVKKRALKPSVYVRIGQVYE